MSNSRGRNEKATQQGFTLVETALGLLVLGLFMGAVMSFMPFRNDEFAINVTKERQKRVAVAMSDYANKYGYLPCPSQVWDDLNRIGLTGNEWRDESSASPQNCPQQVGIIPFRNLGLSMQDAYDGFGNLMSYTVTADATLIFENNPRDVDNVWGVSSQIADRCQVRELWFDPDPLVMRNRNIAKARFCCREPLGSPPERSNQIIWYENGQLAEEYGPTDADRRLLDSDPNVSMPTKGTITYFTYVLRSHGRNGGFAWIFNDGGVWGRIPSLHMDMTTSNPEEMWPVTRINFYNMIKDTPAYSDDIVLWRTQEMTIAETNKTSCAVPF